MTIVGEVVRANGYGANHRVIGHSLQLGAKISTDQVI